MKEIKLSKQGKHKNNFVALVDDEDFERVNNFRWCVAKMGNLYYVLRVEKTNGKKIRIFMHRFIMNINSNMEIDHIDHNGLNNQKYNLRICTRSQNIMNARPYGKSSYKGVCIHYDKYIQSSIYVNGKSIYLGTYKTEIGAALAYNEAAIKYFGEFAFLNNIEFILKP